MAHQAPCRDLAISPVNENCLVSVGYDSLISLYDTRTKMASIQLSTAHPLSAVAVSPCGSFCCVGNLKGQLLAYDFRQLLEPLIQTKDSHSSTVKRVEFLPTADEVSFNEKHQETLNRGLTRRDSMQSFFDHHSKQPRLPEQRKLSNLFSGENTSGTRISVGHDLRRLLQEEETVRSRDQTLSDSSASSSSSDVEFVGFTPGQAALLKEPATRTSTTTAATAGRTEPTTPLMSMASNVVAENRSVAMAPKRLARLNMTVEQAIPEQEEEVEKKTISRPARNSIQTSTPLNSGAQSSTPSSVNGGAAGKKLVIPDKYLGDGDSLANRVNIPAVVAGSTGGDNKAADNSQVVPMSSSNGTTNAVLDAQLAERMERLEMQMEFRMEQNMWEFKNYTTLVYMKQMDKINELQQSVIELTAGMNCLVRSDDFIDEYFKLRQENEELKARLMGNGH